MTDDTRVVSIDGYPDIYTDQEFRALERLAARSAIYQRYLTGARCDLRHNPVTKATDR